jgi:hypothetical protein
MDGRWRLAALVLFAAPAWQERHVSPFLRWSRWEKVIFGFGIWLGTGKPLG